MISEDKILEAVALLAADPSASAGAMGVSEQEAARLRNFIPEAFGLVLAAHMCETLVLPATFRVDDADGVTHYVPMAAEPVFVHALHIAQQTYHGGPRSTFQALSERSAVVDMINKALNAGGSLDGASISPLYFDDIPAEQYHSVITKQAHCCRPVEGYVPDAATAIGIAVAIWEPLYGKDAIARQAPYRAALHGDVWLVEGSLGERRLGGVALVEIARDDGRIIRVSHGR